MAVPPIHTEPPSIWPEALRLCPGRPLPPYRRLPGHTPHPCKHPQGHRFGVDTALNVNPPWATCEAYRYGIDLYHQGYLWESHEAWESLWRVAGRDTIEGRFIQALIRNSAALLKAHLGNRRGALTHSRAAHALLEQVAEEIGPGGTLLHVDVNDLLTSIGSCYRPLWEGGPLPVGPAPHILHRALG